MSSLSLEALSQAEFDVDFPRAFEHFVSEVMVSRGVSREEAEEHARRSYESLLPGGQINAPNQHLYKLMFEGTRVGHMYFSINVEKPLPDAFLWDIAISDAQRGKGFGKQAMQLLEAQARKLGASVIRLNVFGHNTVARGLYASLGYEPASMQLFKEI
jgi:ribosomal protein S18 acetylase RimI-like enzyme